VLLVGDVVPSIRSSNRSAIPAACSTSAQLALEVTTARAARPRARPSRSDRAVVDLDPCSSISAMKDQLVLAVADAVDVSASGSSSGPPSGRLIPREARKERTPS
jgi:hypothetical protein